MSENDYQVELANLCVQFLDFAIKLYLDGKITIEEFNLMSKEKIDYLGYKDKYKVANKI